MAEIAECDSTDMVDIVDLLSAGWDTELNGPCDSTSGFTLQPPGVYEVDTDPNSESESGDSSDWWDDDIDPPIDDDDISDWDADADPDIGLVVFDDSDS